MFIDYETLKLVWWVFIGVLLIGFAITDGFDMGVAAWLPFLGKTDDERRVIINSVGATWEGNQTWLVTAAGAIFAAWPFVYAAAFSGLYIALLLVLFALFFRPVGFDYRSKLADPRWRNGWDWALFTGGAVPALVFGIAFGNLLLGVPFHLDDTMRSFYTGSFWALLNPFALLAGVLSLAMLMMHGAIYLELRTDGVVQQRARKAALYAGLVTAGSVHGTHTGRYQRPPRRARPLPCGSGARSRHIRISAVRSAAVSTSTSRTCHAACSFATLPISPQTLAWVASIRSPGTTACACCVITVSARDRSP